MTKKCSTGRTIRTRSSALASSASTEQQTTPGLSLRRTTRLGTQSTSTKPITPTSSTRRSERLASSPALLTKVSGKLEKKPTLRRSYKGKTVSSDKPGKNANNSSSDFEESKSKEIDNIEELTDEMKKQEPKMTDRSYRALCRGQRKKEANAGNDVARDDSSSSHGNSESKGLTVSETSVEKAPDFTPEVTRDTEKMVLDSSFVIGTGDDGVVISSPSENPETQKLCDSKTSLETDIDLSLKRKRDTAVTVMDACPNADDRSMSSDGLTPSPSGCTNNNQPERCSTCQKRQKVNDDFENLFVCSCIAQPVQETDHMTQDMRESEPSTSRDYGENRQNMQQDKSYDLKLSSMYQEYWVPVQLSDVQMEQYCRTLFSKSLSLSSLSKNDLVGALQETFTSVMKTCDHPYVMDKSMKPLLTKNLELHEILDVEIKASGKLHLLDGMLTQIQAKGLKAVVFYQATQSPEGLLLGNILEDFVSQRFGQNSYEHGVCLSKKSAIDNFNKESQCFILLLETRACSQSIKLLRAEAFILFGSSLNPSHDVKLLEKIKIESSSGKTKIFRLYSVCTVEEKALILARQCKPLENLHRSLTHALLMWGASYLFDKLDQTPDLRVPSEQSIKEAVIYEFSSILSSNDGEQNEGKLCLLLEANHAQGVYSTDATLFGEEHVKLSEETSPNIFWTKLLGGKNPVWKYCSDTPQRSRKRVRHLQGSEETSKVGNEGNIKKKKKASDDVTVVNDERKASGKDHIGDLESPKVTTLKSSGGSGFGTNDSLNGNDANGLYSMGGHISGIPEDMLAGIDWRQIPRGSQRSLYAVLKPEMAKLCPSEDSASMAEKFLEYIIENHRVCKEPATILQAFELALSWIAASFVKQKCNREESLVRAKSELGYSCSREEVDYIYSFLYCMKSLFLTEKRGSHYSLVTKDVEKTISDIKRKCSEKLQKLIQTREEKKVDMMKRNADKKQKLQACKKVEVSYIRVTCSRLSTQSLKDNLQRVEEDFKRKNDDLERETNECLKSLEQMHEAAMKKLAEDEACWISRLEKWAQAEFINCAPMPSSLGGNQPDPAGNTQGKSIEAEVEPEPVESPKPSSPAGPEPDPAANIQGKTFDPAIEPQLAGSPIPSSPAGQPHTTDACEMEVAEPDAQVEHPTFEPSGVTAPVPSHLNNATRQTAIQPVPQIPFSVFSDPFQHELEKLRRESENTKKTYEEKKSVLKAELDRKMAELQAEYQRKFHEIEAEHKAKTTKIVTTTNLTIMNKLLASAFLSKCTSRMASAPIQQLAQRPALVNALRNYYTASAPAPLQAQTSSFPSSVSCSSGLRLNSTHCPMPQPKQPLISNTAPSLVVNASATSLAVNARLVSPAPDRNLCRSSSSSIPIPTTSPTSSAVPQALTYPTALIEQQEHQHQQNLGSGLQESNDVVCLSDDE